MYVRVLDLFLCPTRFSPGHMSHKQSLLPTQHKAELHFHTHSHEHICTPSTSHWSLLCKQSRLADDAKRAYYDLHISPKSMHDRNGGAHFQFLQNVLQRNNGGKGYVAGDKLSIADVQVCVCARA